MLDTKKIPMMILGMTIRYPGGEGLGVSVDKKLFISSLCSENIFFTFSVPEYIHGAWAQIFFSPLVRRNIFISKFFLASPPLGYLMVAPLDKPGTNAQLKNL